VFTDLLWEGLNLWERIHSREASTFTFSGA